MRTHATTSFQKTYDDGSNASWEVGEVGSCLNLLFVEESCINYLVFRSISTLKYSQYSPRFKHAKDLTWNILHLFLHFSTMLISTSFSWPLKTFVGKYYSSCFIYYTMQTLLFHPNYKLFLQTLSFYPSNKLSELAQFNLQTDEDIVIPLSFAIHPLSAIPFTVRIHSPSVVLSRYDWRLSHPIQW